MFPIGISLFTAVAGAVFGIALLWVMAQWLKVDEAAAVGEQDVRKGVERLHEQVRASMQSAKEPPTADVLATLDRYGDPFPTTTPTDAAAEEAEREAVPLAQDETALSRLLFGWGASGMVFGLVFGGVSAGAAGAVIGGFLGSTLGIVVVVLGVLVLDRIGAKKSSAGTPQK